MQGSANACRKRHSADSTQAQTGTHEGGLCPARDDEFHSTFRSKLLKLRRAHSTDVRLLLRRTNSSVEDSDSATWCERDRSHRGALAYGG